MIRKQRQYFSYLLRLWCVDGNQTPVWYASLENPHTGERLHFRSTARLFAFLEDQCTAKDRGEEPPTAS